MALGYNGGRSGFFEVVMKTIGPADLQGLYRPPADSHKGQNGRLLVIGGSKLFHSSIFWTADVASRIVDLVHFSSPAMENNDLVRKRTKEKFWNGIVVPWERVEEYILEDDCVVIGPGMPRREGLEVGEQPTEEIVNGLLQKFPGKRWVIDGGALQEVDPGLFNDNMIVTPHGGEFRRLLSKIKSLIFKVPFDSFDEAQDKFAQGKQNYSSKLKINDGQLAHLVGEVSKYLGGVTVLLKGKKDIICWGEECVVVEGGNEAMTKGGTGDVLAGLVGALYCKDEAFLAAKAGSFINKQAGDRLFRRVGPYFNAGDLVAEVPAVMKEVLAY